MSSRLVGSRQQAALWLHWFGHDLNGSGLGGDEMFDDCDFFWGVDDDPSIETIRGADRSFEFFFGFAAIAINGL